MYLEHLCNPSVYKPWQIRGVLGLRKPLILLHVQYMETRHPVCLCVFMVVLYITLFLYMCPDTKDVQVFRSHVLYPLVSFRINWDLHPISPSEFPQKPRQRAADQLRSSCSASPPSALYSSHGLPLSSPLHPPACYIKYTLDVVHH